MTYLDFIQNCETFATGHPTLATFSHGELPDLSAEVRGHNLFPIMNTRLERVEISTPSQNSTPVASYIIEIVFMDVLKEDKSNEVYLLNSLIEIIKDLYVEPFIYNNLVSTLVGTPGPYYLSENLFGFRLTITIDSGLEIHCF